MLCMPMVMHKNPSDKSIYHWDSARFLDNVTFPVKLRYNQLFVNTVRCDPFPVGIQS